MSEPSNSHLSSGVRSCSYKNFIILKVLKEVEKVWQLWIQLPNSFFKKDFLLYLPDYQLNLRGLQKLTKACRRYAKYQSWRYVNIL